MRNRLPLLFSIVSIIISAICLLQLLSCSKSVLTVSQDKPIFQLGMPFEGGSAVEPVKSMPMWTPVVCTTFNSYVPSKKEAASCVKTILGVDTTSCDSLLDIAGKRLKKIDSLYLVMNSIIDDCFSDTVYVQKIVHSRFLAYLMLVIGFIVGVFTVLILNYITRKKSE